MKSTITNMTLLVLVFFSAACAGSFRVISPKAFQTASQEFSIVNNRILVIVKFNRPVNRDSLIIGKTLIFDTEKVKNASGTLTWSKENRMVAFHTDQSVEDLIHFDSDGDFTLNLLGSESEDSVIKDVDGAVLDGDSDGSGGGNYSTTFRIIG